MASLQSLLILALLCNPLLRTDVNDDRWNDPMPVIRQRFDRLTSSAVIGAVPGGTVIQPVATGAFSGEWLVPAGAPQDKVLLYFHGGGYVMGSCQGYHAMISNIGKACGLRTLSLEYRLAPDHPFPAGLEDAVASYRWLLNQGFAPQNIAIAGDSGGGGLCLATLLTLRDRHLPLPSCAVCLSPVTDFKGTGASMKLHEHDDPIISHTVWRFFQSRYVGNNPPDHPLISPLYADLRGLPPLLIHVGTKEILQDDSIRLAEKAKQAGVEVKLKVWDDMWHFFQAFTRILPEARTAVQDIGDFVKAHCGTSASSVSSKIQAEP